LYADDYDGKFYDRDEVYEFLLAVGNISAIYKNCYNDNKGSIYSAVAWGNQFPDGQTYGLYIIPNMLK
jgi:hypothetical protein